MARPSVRTVDTLSFGDFRKQCHGEYGIATVGSYNDTHRSNFCQTTTAHDSFQYVVPVDFLYILRIRRIYYILV